MKKIFFVIIVISQFIFPQEGYKGKISLILDGEIIEAPITSIILRKEDDLILTARAELNETNLQKLISIEIIFKGDTLSDKQKELRINVKTANKFESSGRELSFHYPPDDATDSFIRYSSYNKQEHLSWRINSIGLQFVNTNPVFENGTIKINGYFFGTITPSSPDDKKTIEIKDGKFEISI
jgi:hypothetical protein